jgi:hypothetical protein
VKRVVPFAVLSLALLTDAQSAHAYCFTTTCKDVPACQGEPQPDDCRVIGWASRCVGFSVQEDNRDGIKADTLEEIVELAFDTWRSVDCGNGSPGFVAQNLGQVPCDKQQYNKEAANANIILMRIDDWPYGVEKLALTTTTYDPETGDLSDADMEINGFDYDFTVSDESVEYDLLSVVTHEVGHLMGLAHSNMTGTTMDQSYTPGTTEIRVPGPDDIAAICELYPPDDAPKKTCNPLPKHGFSPYCRDEQPEGSCAAGRASSDEAGPTALVSLALAFAALLRRKRRLSARA